MNILAINMMKAKQLLSLFLCLLTTGFSLKVQAQDSETLRRTYQQVIELYPQNLEAARKQGNRVFEAQVISGAALGYQYLGDYQKALELFREALAIAKSIPDRAMISQVFNGMASTYSKLGDYQGINFFEEQLKQARANGDRLMIGITLNSLGLAYLSLPDYQKSIASYEEYLPMVRG